MASCSRDGWLRTSPATWKAMSSSAITSTLHILSWPACSFPVYTVGLVALLASYSYVGTLRMSDLGAVGDGQGVYWSSSIASGVAAHDNSSTDCGGLACDVNTPDYIVASEEQSGVECMTAWSSWNASSTALPHSMASPSARFAVDSTLLGISLAELEDSCTRADSISTSVQSKARHQGQPMDGHVKPEHTAWAIGSYPNGQLMTADNAITAIQWIGLHITVVSLFIAMRRLGSNFWLAIGVLMSSTYAFSFGLVVTVRLGFPVTAGLLLEGLPFFVNIIGFPKHVMLTKAVLTHNLGSALRDTAFEPLETVVPPTQDAIRKAIGEVGSTMVRRYAIEILLSVGGFLLTRNTTGGLHSFSALAIWVLTFDCILLFTFFIAVLMVKLEISRIRRQVDIGDNLEEEGISHDVAVSVARRTAPLNSSDAESPVSRTVDPPSKLSRFAILKAVMVAVFITINILNLYAVPLRHNHPWMQHVLSRHSSGANRSANHVFSSMTSTPIGMINPKDWENNETIIVTTTPLRGSVNDISSGSTQETASFMVAPTVEGFLESLEDPILSKWIAVFLALSVVFNGYLFRAATTRPAPRRLVTAPIDRRSLVKAEDFTSAASETEVPLRPDHLTGAAAVSAEDAQKMESLDTAGKQNASVEPTLTRSPEELDHMLKVARTHELSDEEVASLSLNGKLPSHALEKTLRDYTRAVKIRRSVISRSKATIELTKGLEGSKLPYRQYNYDDVFGACCENVIGYMPLPLGVAGPLVIDGRSYYIPMATTEGVLIASTSRGCKAINAGGGATTVITGDGMTRGPCVRFETLKRAGDALTWLHSEAGRDTMKKAFDSTSRFARLESIRAVLAGPEVFIRFKTSTGDAMGMNMVSKGVEQSLKIMRTEGFDDMKIVSLSGNYCSDKKATAINWIEGRGKSVVAEAIIPGNVVCSVLKTSVDALVDLNISKNLVGSAMAGSIGGFNAHAANIVAAIYIATGQDPAQVVESASCITTMRNLGGSLQVCVSMPSVEVGTLGGGTILEPQAAMLAMLGVRGPHPTTPGENARQLARIVAATTLAGELSLCGALSAGQLVQAHMQHNRGGKK